VDYKDVTLSDLKGLVAELRDVRSQKDGLNAQLSELEKNKKRLEDKIIPILEQSNLTSFNCEFGRVTRSARFSVKFPKDDQEKKAALRAYLDSKGIFDDSWTFNHQSLNSFYKEELEAAAARGDEDFEIPGLEATTDVTLSFTKG
jgi:hypothetical protein